MWEVYKSLSFIVYLIRIKSLSWIELYLFFLPHYSLCKTYKKKVMNQSEEIMNPEWHNIADVAVQRICDNSIINLTLYVKLINGEHFYKVNGEHVRILPGVEYVNGFGYNAVTASYRLYL